MSPTLRSPLPSPPFPCQTGSVGSPSHFLRRQECQNTRPAACWDTHATFPKTCGKNTAECAADWIRTRCVATTWRVKCDTRTGHLADNPWLTGEITCLLLYPGTQTTWSVFFVFFITYIRIFIFYLPETLQKALRSDEHTSNYIFETFIFSFFLLSAKYTAVISTKRNPLIRV